MGCADPPFILRGRCTLSVLELTKKEVDESSIIYVLIDEKKRFTCGDELLVVAGLCCLFVCLFVWESKTGCSSAPPHIVVRMVHHGAKCTHGLPSLEHFHELSHLFP